MSDKHTVGKIEQLTTDPPIFGKGHRHGTQGNHWSSSESAEECRYLGKCNSSRCPCRQIGQTENAALVRAIAEGQEAFVEVRRERDEAQKELKRAQHKAKTFEQLHLAAEHENGIFKRERDEARAEAEAAWEAAEGNYAEMMRVAGFLREARSDLETAQAMLLDAVAARREEIHRANKAELYLSDVYPEMLRQRNEVLEQNDNLEQERDEARAEARAAKGEVERLRKALNGILEAFNTTGPHFVAKYKLRLENAQRLADAATANQPGHGANQAGEGEG